MSMTPAPHPLRCETCKNWNEEDGFVTQCPLSKFSHNYEKFGDYRRTMSTIKYIGCASHTSASSDVLDRENIIDYFCEVWMMDRDTAIKYIKELGCGKGGR